MRVNVLSAVADRVRAVRPSSPRLPERGLGLLSTLLGLALWQAYATTQPAYLVPGLDAIYAAFREQLATDGLAGAFAGTVATVVVGFLAATVVGVALGVAMGVDRRLAVLLNPYVNALYVAPVSALVPLLVLIGGIDFTTRAFVVFLFAVFEITVTIYEGIAAMPDDLVDVARSFGADRRFVLGRVVLPYGLPYVFAGLRLGIGRAIKGAVLAELLVEFTNLGRIVRLWQDDFRVAGVLAVVALLMAFGVVCTRSIGYLGDRLLDWHPEAKL